ncbi:hypothetical protein QYZ88_014555 [Lachnospiraceae bacterium C1.1]|nr:hypothetical protein [Lachnospiraceae bacterium C1.1]
MKKNLLAICDKDEEYVTRLMNFILERKTMPLEVHSFTEIEYLKNFIKENSVDILLISEDELDEEIEAIAKHELMVLSENGGITDKNGHRSISKYQSLENIMREVMDHYSEKSSPVLRLDKSSATEFIGFYSPVHRCGTTSLALSMGQALAEEKKVLYLNLEEYSGFHQLLGENYMMNLSDLLFYIGQKKTNFPCKLAGMVQTIGKLDFIPPVISPLDIKNVDTMTWQGFFKELTDCGYDSVIIDFGSWAEESMNVFRACGRLFVPMLDDEFSRAKIEQFEAILRILDSEDLLEKMEKVIIPKFNSAENPLLENDDSKLRRYAMMLLGKGQKSGERSLIGAIA